ncbi:hypothetical protein OL548_21440 [Lysinibacillus sp. MHQ-1]|nr:hypothetical protein OL548_21440 [Lysinibacillus sp. MHQ-1]
MENLAKLPNEQEQQDFLSEVTYKISRISWIEKRGKAVNLHRI